MESQLNQARQPSPYEQAQAAELNRVNQFLDSRDYRNLPTGVHIPLLDLAEGRRMRQMMRGTGDNVAKGALTADARRNQAELDDNVFARDWGAAYEEQVGNLKNRALGLTDTLQGQYTNRMQMGLQGYNTLLGNSLQRPRGSNIFGSILQMGAQALPSILAAI